MNEACFSSWPHADVGGRIRGHVVIRGGRPACSLESPAADAAGRHAAAHARIALLHPAPVAQLDRASASGTDHSRPEIQRNPVFLGEIKDRKRSQGVRKWLAEAETAGSTAGSRVPSVPGCPELQRHSTARRQDRESGPRLRHPPPAEQPRPHCSDPLPLKQTEIVNRRSNARTSGAADTTAFDPLTLHAHVPSGPTAIGHVDHVATGNRGRGHSAVCARSRAPR